MPKVKKPKPKAPPPDDGLIIAVDTRESLPYQFEGLPCRTMKATLKTGDYGVWGDPRFAVERKSLADAYQSFSRNRARFERELERSAAMEQFHIVLEFDMIHQAPKETRVKVGTVVNSLFAWSIKYGCRVWFCGNRAAAQKTTFRLCRNWRKMKKAESPGGG